ncbi:MAG: tetratricopeptide repeat protein, partial [Anaerolineae bacterium]
MKAGSQLGARRLGLWRITGVLAAVGLLAACASPSPDPDLLTPETYVEHLQNAGGGVLSSPLDVPSAEPTAPATSGHVDPLPDAREALSAYVPVADAQPVVTILLSSIADWLGAGGEPATLETILNETPTQVEHKPVTVTELDLTGDGRQDVVVRFPVMGLPLLAFVDGGGTPTRFDGHALPPDLEAIQTDFPLEGTEIDKPAVQLEDLTGDGVPEVLFSSMFPGASSYRLRPNAFQWHEDGFRLVFAADLVSWAGTSNYTLEPDLSGQGSLQIVLTYPHLYSHGFDHKMVNHPPGRQVWRWNPGVEKFVLSEEQVDLEQSAWESGSEPGLPVTAGDQLRWLTNEAEAAFRTGAYEEALRRYGEVLRQAETGNWQPEEGEADWQAYATFRRAETLLLLSQPSSGLPEMAALATEMEDDLLGQLAQAFL